jgi:hypothetical protein
MKVKGHIGNCRLLMKPARGNQLPTEAAEENVVEIEAICAANPKTKLMT